MLRKYSQNAKIILINYPENIQKVLRRCSPMNKIMPETAHEMVRILLKDT